MLKVLPGFCNSKMASFPYVLPSARQLACASNHDLTPAQFSSGSRASIVESQTLIFVGFCLFICLFLFCFFLWVLQLREEELLCCTKAFFKCQGKALGRVMCFSLAALTCFLLPLSAVHFRKGNSTIHNVSHEITVPSGLLLSWEKLALHKLCNNSVFLSQMAHFFQNSKACCIYLAMLISLGCIHFILLCKFKETLVLLPMRRVQWNLAGFCFSFPSHGIIVICLINRTDLNPTRNDRERG